MRITSTRNPLVKFVRSLERASTRQQEDKYIVEGVRLVQEAIGAREHPVLAIYDPDQLSSTAAGSLLLTEIPKWAGESYEVDARVLAACAQTEAPAGVVVILRKHDPLPLQEHDGARFGIILDRIADPGNAGTLLRTADALGVDYVVALAGSVDLYAPKVVRAGMGAHFRLPIYQARSWPELKGALPQTTFVGIDTPANDSIYDFCWPQSAAIVVGNEAHGISRDSREHLAHTVQVPMRPGIESLNAGVAGSIVMYAALGPTISQVR